MMSDSIVGSAFHAREINFSQAADGRAATSGPFHPNPGLTMNFGPGQLLRKFQNQSLRGGSEPRNGITPFRSPADAFHRST
jgi:hypothetical protein